MGRKHNDLTGQKFGRLTVIEWRSKTFSWICECECGNTITVPTSKLQSGHTKGCGCLRTKHGWAHSRLYGIWKGMKQRCYCATHDNYENYGQKGVTVCEEWQEFKPFYDWAMANGYREDLTIDRKENDKGYSPENCRWASLKEQANNKRDTHRITYMGETHTLAEWAEKVGVSYDTLYTRIFRYGWSEEKALTSPSQQHKKRMV